MNRPLISAAISIIAMLLTLLAAFVFAHRGVLGNVHSPVSAHSVHAIDPHIELPASACPASPHGVSPRPTLSAKTVIRT